MVAAGPKLEVCFFLLNKKISLDDYQICRRITIIHFLTAVINEEQAIKGALCGFGGDIQTENFNIYNTNEVIIQAHIDRSFVFHNWINKLFSEENKIPRTPFEAWKVAGSATYKYMTVWNWILSFYTVYPVMKMKSLII